MGSILLTGGKGNLGKTIVKTLADVGYYLHLPVRQGPERDSENISYYQADLVERKQVTVLLEKIISIDESVSAGIFLAGGFEPGGLDGTSIEDVYKMIDINFATAFSAAQLLITHFKKNGGGKLIFVGAESAMDFTVAGDNLAYSLSKQLLYNYSALVNEFEIGSGIRSHILLPGIIGTPPQKGLEQDENHFNWTSPHEIVLAVKDILEDKEQRAVIRFGETRVKRG